MSLFAATRLRIRGGFAVLGIRWHPREGPAISRAVLGALAGILLVALSWLVTVRMVWWRPFGAWVASSSYTFAVFLAATALVTANLFLDVPRPEGRRTRASKPGDVLALVLLALVS